MAPAPGRTAEQEHRSPDGRDAGRGGGAHDDGLQHRNEVLLVGRVAAAAQERELPSGDVLCTWRLVVARPPEAPRGGVRPVPVDTLDCITWRAGVRRSARALQVDDVVVVQGALRRRFWRSGAGAASRCEVEVGALRRLARPGPRARVRKAAAAQEAPDGAEDARGP